MPDRYGRPDASDQAGYSDTCTRCGAAIPTMDDEGVAIFERDKEPGGQWEQLCPDCSDGWNSISDGQTGQDITP